MSKRIPKRKNIFVYLSFVIVLIASLLSPIVFAPKPANAEAQPSYRYTKTFDTANGQADGRSVTTDISGNIYVTGYFTGTVIFDGIDGVDSQTTTSLGGNAFLTKYNPNGSYAWTKTFDATSGSASGNSVTTDSGGNIYVTGYFSGAVIFDGVGGSDSQTTASTNGDTYLTKYNPNGSYGWTKTFDADNGQSVGEKVITDSNNNIYLTGSYTHTVIFDGVGGSDSHTTPDNNSGSYITRYNSNGGYGWTKIVDTTNGYASGNGIAINSSGDIYLAGYFFRTVILDGTGGSDIHSSVGGGDFFLIKYNPNGSYVWSKTFDSTNGSADGRGIASDAQGNIYVTGYFSNTIIFDGPGGTDGRTTLDGHSSLFITKFNHDGSYGWTKITDTTNGYSYGSSLAADSHGGIYITGTVSGTVIFDGPGGTDISTVPDDIDGISYLMKYNSDGSYGWTQTSYSSDGQSFGGGVAADVHDNIYVVGYFSGTTIFDGFGGRDARTSENTSSFVTSFQILPPSTPVQPSPISTIANHPTRTALPTTNNNATTPGVTTSDSTEPTTTITTTPSSETPKSPETPKSTSTPDYMWWYIGGGSGLLILFLLAFWRRSAR